jgi:hypothetical protein
VLILGTVTKARNELKRLHYLGASIRVNRSHGQPD